MHPVEPSTMVRGPAALTISFITRADSQPWQGRGPGGKNSSIGTFWTPLNGSRICVAFVNVVSAIVGISLWLLAHAEPVRLGVGLAGLGRREAHVGRLGDVFQGDLASAQAADEAQERGTLVRVVHRGADLVGHHARVEGRSEGVVAVDDPDGRGLRERLAQPIGREGPEPAGTSQRELLAQVAY